MKKINKHYLTLILILFVSFLLRVILLGSYPVHLTSDEAALGYNAFSILKTARDEHGRLLPVLFESFGDWKPGLYVYTAVPSILFLGLSEFAVRLPSALVGVVAIWFIYKIASLLFNKEIGLFSAALLAITPWHITFSRGAWEANLALTLLLVAVYYFLVSVRNNSIFLISSAFFFAISLWAYQGAKMSGLLVLLILLLLFGKAFFKMPKKHVFASLILGIVIALPIIVSLFNGKAGRLGIVSVFSHQRPQSYIEENILQQDGIDAPDFHYALYHSRSLQQIRGVLGRYMNHFSGRYLFFEGDWQNPRHGVPHTGNLLFISAFLIPVGLFAIRTKYWNKYSAFILIWILVSPIPAALTRDSVHAVRSLPMVIPLTIVSAIGFRELYKRARTLEYLWIAVFIVSCIGSLLSLLWYIDAIFIHSPQSRSKHWLYGHKQVVEMITPIQDKYDKIVFSQSYSQPYIFFLFYQQYDPYEYQNKSTFIRSKLGDVGIVEELDNIEFRIVNWSGDKEMNNILVVATLVDVPLDEIRANPQTYTLKEIDYLDGTLAFAVFDIRR